MSLLAARASSSTSASSARSSESHSAKIIEAVKSPETAKKGDAQEDHHPKGELASVGASGFPVAKLMEKR